MLPHPKNNNRILLLIKLAIICSKLAHNKNAFIILTFKFKLCNFLRKTDFVNVLYLIDIRFLSNLKNNTVDMQIISKKLDQP